MKHILTVACIFLESAWQAVCQPFSDQLRRLSSLRLALTALLLAPLAAPAAELSPPALMPRVEDYTLMWWAEGFPGHTPAAPWRRVIQTGRYAMALDTETLRIPHFGPVPAGLGYAAAARADNRAWQSAAAGGTRAEHHRRRARPIAARRAASGRSSPGRG